MKRRTLCLFLLTALSQNHSFAKPHIMKDTKENNPLGIVPFEIKSPPRKLGSFCIFTTSDNTLMATSFSGHRTAFSGQIWKASPTEKTLTSQEIKTIHHHTYNRFTGAVPHPDKPNILFVCSVRVNMSTDHPENKPVPNNLPSSSVIVLEKDSQGIYHWKKTIRMANDRKQPHQFCSKLITLGSYLLALNEYKNRAQSPAIEYILISDKMANRMSTAATYEQLGFTGKESDRKHILTDFSVTANEDPDHSSLFVLDQYNKKLIRLHLKNQMTSLSFDRIVKEYPLPLDIQIPLSFANYNDTSFLLGSVNKDHTINRIDQIRYTEDSKKHNKAQIEILPIATPPLTALSLFIGHDRFGLTEEKVVFASISNPYITVHKKTGVYEYKFKN